MVRVHLGPRSYDIAILSGDSENLGAFARGRTPGHAAYVVTDEHVRPHADKVAAALSGAAFQIRNVILPPGEAQKSLAVVSVLYDRLAEAHADRTTLIVAVGGGVVGDLAGFVAATYARGLPLLMVPTTLLAMVDSSVGGKVGVNHPRAKNLIGAFHQPVGVWIDTDALATLPDREYRSGLAEAVKYGIAIDADLFTFLEAHADALLARDAEAVRFVICRCCQLKADVVEEDEHETRGRRAKLNYGHTFAHAFETATGYGTWLHGEAVAAGMVCAGRLACLRGLLDPELAGRQEKLLARFGLPTAPPHQPAEALMAAMRSDKKAQAGRLRFILLRGLGDAYLCDTVPEADVRRLLEEFVAPAETGFNPTC